MCGIALKHAGHQVEIIEREGNQRQSHMSGICLGFDAQAFLAEHDRLTQTYSHRSNCLQTVGATGPPKVFVNMVRDLTSWDMLYARLRSCYDGYVSKIYPQPPAPLKGDGKAIYSHCKEVIDIRRTDAGSKQQMVLSVLDRDTRELTDVKADMVIGADGPDSFVRSKYLPRVKRQYVGYIAWRGTVPESEVSQSTRELFHRSITLQLVSMEHCMIYAIPGPDGSLEPGKRLLNVVWYLNESEASLQEILIDGLDGHRHRNTVPAGHVREDIWAARLRHARQSGLTAPLLEVLHRIERPFLQVITDFCSPRATFEDGKVLLVGDALTLFRPHTALSGTQAAFDAMRVQDYVSGKISVQQWEADVVGFARLHWSQSVWWGGYYQHRRPIALLFAARYWAYCALDRVKSWWHGGSPLLRTAGSRVIPYES
jgi:2-polyprenyl-6-methoxyphenol hydroxylase-like FAD-dependent oxidoreductase